MSKYRYFTEEEMELLRSSGYVKNVTEKQVMFNEVFKERFIELYRGGNRPRDALQMLGINPDILGKKRLDSLSKRIKAMAIRPEGFTRKDNSSKGKKRKPTFESTEEELEYYK